MPPTSAADEPELRTLDRRLTSDDVDERRRAAATLYQRAEAGELPANAPVLGLYLAAADEDRVTRIVARAALSAGGSFALDAPERVSAVEWLTRARDVRSRRAAGASLRWGPASGGTAGSGSAGSGWTGDGSIGSGATGSLAERVDAFREALDDEDVVVRRHAAALLQDVAANRGPTSERTDPRRERADRAGGRTDPAHGRTDPALAPAVPALADALEDPDARVRGHALGALSRHLPLGPDVPDVEGYADAIRRMVWCLQDDDRRVRAAALSWLRESDWRRRPVSRDPRLLEGEDTSFGRSLRVVLAEGLATCLAADGTRAPARARAAAELDVVTLLAHPNPASVVPTLLDALDDDVEAVVAGVDREDDGVGRLLARLADRRPELLAPHGGRLLGLLDDERDRVRRYATLALAPLVEDHLDDLTAAGGGPGGGTAGGQGSDPLADRGASRPDEDGVDPLDAGDDPLDLDGVDPLQGEWSDEPIEESPAEMASAEGAGREEVGAGREEVGAGRGEVPVEESGPGQGQVDGTGPDQAAVDGADAVDRTVETLVELLDGGVPPRDRPAVVHALGDVLAAYPDRVADGWRGLSAGLESLDAATRRAAASAAVDVRRAGPDGLAVAPDLQALGDAGRAYEARIADGEYASPEPLVVVADAAPDAAVARLAGLAGRIDPASVQAASGSVDSTRAASGPGASRPDATPGASGPPDAVLRELLDAHPDVVRRAMPAFVERLGSDERAASRAVAVVLEDAVAADPRLLLGRERGMLGSAADGVRRLVGGGTAGVDGDDLGRALARAAAHRPVPRPVASVLASLAAVDPEAVAPAVPGLLDSLAAARTVDRSLAARALAAIGPDAVGAADGDDDRMPDDARVHVEALASGRPGVATLQADDVGSVDAADPLVALVDVDPERVADWLVTVLDRQSALLADEGLPRAVRETLPRNVAAVLARLERAEQGGSVDEQPEEEPGPKLPGRTRGGGTVADVLDAIVALGESARGTDRWLAAHLLGTVVRPTPTTRSAAANLLVDLADDEREDVRGVAATRLLALAWDLPAATLDRVDWFVPACTVGFDRLHDDALGARERSAIAEALGVLADDHPAPVLDGLAASERGVPGPRSGLLASPDVDRLSAAVERARDEVDDDREGERGDGDAAAGRIRRWLPF